MLAQPPRHYLDAGWPGTALSGLGTGSGSGTPRERLARIAARRAFVGMKQRFVDAVAGIPGQRGDWLRFQVRHAQAPVDLWLLRGAVFASLQDGCRERRTVRHDLRRALDSAFPDSAPQLPFAATL